MGGMKSERTEEDSGAMTVRLVGGGGRIRKGCNDHWSKSATGGRGETACICSGSHAHAFMCARMLMSTLSRWMYCTFSIGYNVYNFHTISYKSWSKHSPQCCILRPFLRSKNCSLQECRVLNVSNQRTSFNCFWCSKGDSRFMRSVPTAARYPEVVWKSECASGSLSPLLSL